MLGIGWLILDRLTSDSMQVDWKSQYAEAGDSAGKVL